MRVVFCGRKRIALRALDVLVEQGCEILAIVGKDSEAPWVEQPSFQDGAVARGMATATLPQVLRSLASDCDGAVGRFFTRPIDMVISFLFPERIPRDLLNIARVAAINFHPAPLPEYGGCAGLNCAILEGHDSYAVTAHHMDENLDTGDIILRRDFPIDSHRLTVLELERLSRHELFELFKDVISIVVSGKPLPRKAQTNTCYISRSEQQRMKLIDINNDSADEVDRKARAFWYPPYDGARIRIGDSYFTIVPRRVLESLGDYRYRHVLD